MNDSLFSVRGSGSFPFIMLQKGRCHPVSEKDVDNLFNYSGQRTISLRGQLPSDDLWKVYGWSIILRPPIYKDDCSYYHTWPC